ncbi:MAG TPA: DUF1501 domain-containing protein [Planctomycetota bacterium]|jgi:uncharacterized protein (DUF1501 family)|nr:DUF1501 domain-containing protein [Planctomycetota bacterium]
MMQPHAVRRLDAGAFRRHLRELDRRSFLRVGMLGAAGLALPDLLRLEARAAEQGRSPRRMSSVIILWMRGGPSQHETWDPKPDAPSEYRGPFGSIRTKVPGIRICELLPRSAALMHRWSIVRSLHHDNAGHSAADQICFTGYPPGPDAEANVAPSCGSVVARQLQAQNPRLPAYVMIPRMVPGTDAAYLGVAYRPFETLADPADGGPFRVPNLQAPAALSLERLADRRRLLEDLDRLRRSVDTSGMMEAMDRFHQSAWEIVTGPEARRAFDLDAEPRKVRERYGFMPEFKAPTPDRCGCPAWSQRILLARRLVEAGVRLVTVDLRWWDTHVEGIDSMKNGFLPRWDQAYSALIEDLHERGLLESTMVVAWGEFGRTPKLNDRNGRDHWPGVFSAAIAGGGVQGGRVVGASDDKGAYPKDNPKRPQDVLATIYRHLGVDIHAEYPDFSGRPRPVLPFGEPIEELF